MERRFTTWTVNPKFGLRNNFLTPQTPNIIFNEIKDQLESPKFLRLGGFFSFGVCALPEGVLWPEDVPKNDPSLNSYMQVAGVHEAMTVEVRVSDGGDSYSHDGGDSYSHYVVAREPVADPEAWTTVSWDNGNPEPFTTQVHPEEVFSGEQAVPVFRAYIEEGALPPTELLRRIDV